MANTTQWKRASKKKNDSSAARLYSHAGVIELDEKLVKVGITLTQPIIDP